MKNLKLVMLCACFLVGKASAQTLKGRETVISIQKMYSNNIPTSFRSLLDSTIQATADRFNNNGNREFNVSVNDSSAEHRVMLNITKGKLATKRQRNIAYLVNLIVPVYIPMHKIKSSIELPADLVLSNDARAINSSAHILVGNISKREGKLLQKYADKLFKELNNIEVRPSSGLQSRNRHPTNGIDKSI